MILRLKKRKLVFACLLLLGGLNSCSFFKEEETSGDPKFNLRTVNIILDTDANNYSATEIDLVVVYKIELLKSLMTMKAADYFAIAEQVRRDYPEMIKVWHWELTPGQAINNYPLNACFMCPDAFGAVVFARYLTPGSHRVRVGSSDAIHILLKKDDLCIIEQGCPNNSVILPTRSATGARKEKDSRPSRLSKTGDRVKK